MTRFLCWFSHGAASAVAAKLVIAEGHDDVRVVLTETGSEHPDNARFRRDCSLWFGCEIVELSSGKYEDTWDVWEKTRFLVGPSGARCTGELKKKVRYAYEQPGDVQIFGYTADSRDATRADRLRETHPEITVRFPLIERGLTKKDCLGLLERQGIELPAMYRMGYQNNNCIGCVKGGAGYWNKIRRDFPDVFDRMAELEQRLGATCLRQPDPSGALNDNGRVRTIPLRLIDLDPAKGRYADEVDIECGPTCSTVADELEGDFDDYE